MGSFITLTLIAILKLSLAAPNDALFTCPSDFGHFPHPYDCQFFYHCNWGTPHLKECPANLHFNPILEVCDWPWDAGCTVGTTPEPTTEEPCFENNPIDVVSYKALTDIKYRYSITRVSSRVHNRYGCEVRHNFEVIFSNKAFVSDYEITLHGSQHKGQVQRRSGSTIPEGRNWVRNANVFYVNATIPPRSSVDFSLVIEEVLESKTGFFQQTSYLNPNFIGKVQDIELRVEIEETKNITFFRVPFNVHDAVIEPPVLNEASVVWKPSRIVNGSAKCAVNQYTVQYNLAKDEEPGGEIIIIEDQFFHFFMPINLLPLRKHVVFLLDVSGSMSTGGRITQLKKAMTIILDDLKSDDYFNLITFSGSTTIWPTSTTGPLPCTPANIQNAKDYVGRLAAGGGTNMNKGLQDTFSLINRAQQSLPTSVGTILIFLTDGEPTDATPQAIINNVATWNRHETPLYSLAFGNGIDFSFLERLALANYGFGKQIFDGADAVEQLRDFYSSISSPVLTNATISYNSQDFIITNLTITKFDTIFGGMEIAVSGTITPLKPGPGPFLITVIIEGIGRDGPVVITKEVWFTFKPKTRAITASSDFNIERIRGNLAIKQLLASDLANPNSTVKETATQLALHHGFLVPPLTVLRGRVSDTQEVNIDPRKINALEGTDCPTGGVLGNLDDLSWFNKQNPTIIVDSTTFRIAVNAAEASNPDLESGNECLVGTEGTYGTGTCVHLRECAQLDFKDNIEAYKSFYFCPIYAKSGVSPGYAGSCCMVDVV